jgi:superfamily II helicase
MKNSDVIFFNEFIQILKRKEYNSKEVEKYFTRLGKIDRKNLCHHCGKKINRFLAKFVRRNFCHFCMDYVCSRDCLSDEQFVIPRNFNIDYDLKKRPVCYSAAMLLNRNNYIKIPSSHP